MGVGSRVEPPKRLLEIAGAVGEGCRCGCNRVIRERSLSVGLRAYILCFGEGCSSEALWLEENSFSCASYPEPISPVHKVDIVGGVRQGGNCALDGVHSRLVDETKPGRCQKVESIP